MPDIFALLSQSGWLSQTSVRMLKRYCHAWQCSGLQAILDTHIFAEPELADMLSQLLHLDRIYTLQPHQEVIACGHPLSYQLARAWECFPNTASDGQNTLEIVMVDPTQEQRIAYFREQVGEGLHLAVGCRSDIIRAIDDHYPLEAQLELGHFAPEETKG